jgi:hypothetical protein
VGQTDAMCDRLKVIDTKENVAQWAAKEIERHMVTITNRPTSLTVTDPPKWVDKVAPGNQGCKIVYEIDPNKDHVSIDSITGRGCWGVLIGYSNFVSALQGEPLFYVAKAKPGLYAYHSRSDY